MLNGSRAVQRMHWAYKMRAELGYPVAFQISADVDICGTCMHKLPWTRAISTGSLGRGLQVQHQHAYQVLHTLHTGRHAGPINTCNTKYNETAHMNLISTSVHAVHRNEEHM